MTTNTKLELRSLEDHELYAVNGGNLSAQQTFAGPTYGRDAVALGIAPVYLAGLRAYQHPGQIVSTPA